MIEKTNINKKAKPNLKFLRDKDRQKVTGIFDYKERPGQTLKFRLRIWKEDPVEFWEFVDGQTYTIPLGVARHLNKNGIKTAHKFVADRSGLPRTKVSKKIRRFGFQSLEFMDPADFSTADSDLITIENVII